MVDRVMSTKTLPEFLFRLIPTEMVQVRELDGEIRLTPVKESTDCIAMLRGSLADYPELSVDKFLERKRLDKVM